MLYVALLDLSANEPFFNVCKLISSVVKAGETVNFE
jgi:hypothetical protein